MLLLVFVVYKDKNTRNTVITWLVLSLTGLTEVPSSMLRHFYFFGLGLSLVPSIGTSSWQTQLYPSQSPLINPFSPTLPPPFLLRLSLLSYGSGPPTSSGYTDFGSLFPVAKVYSELCVRPHLSTSRKPSAQILHLVIRFPLPFDWHPFSPSALPTVLVETEDFQWDRRPTS